MLLLALLQNSIQSRGAQRQSTYFAEKRKIVLEWRGLLGETRVEGKFG